MRLPLARLVDTTRPLEGPGRWRRSLLFGAVALAGAVAAGLLPAAAPRALEAAWLLVAVIVLSTALPWHRWPPAWQAAPAFGYLGVLLLFDYGSGRENAPIFVAILPVVWLALFHSRRLLVAGLAVLGAVLFVPPLLLPAEYPIRPWASLGTAFALAVLLGVALHELVGRQRAVADALERARFDRDLARAYLQTVGALVLVLSPEGRVELFNNRSEQVTGFSAASMVGGEPWQMCTDPDGFRERLTRALASLEPVKFESDIRTAAGVRRHISWVLSALTRDDGGAWAVIAAGVDVTEERAAQRLFAHVLSAATEQMIFATDTTGRFTAFNPGGERLLGYRAEELVGVQTVEIMHRPDELAARARHYGMDSFREVLATATKDESAFTQEWQLIRKDGSEVPVSMTINPMRDDDGTLTGYVGVAWDITRQREVQAATAAALAQEQAATEHARELDRVKGDFVAMVSHDLRTPLTSIIGNTELLLDETGELSTVQRQLLGAVDRNARRLENLVSDLLLLSGVESGKLQLQLRPVTMGQVIDGALEALASKRSADIAVRLEVPADPLRVLGDPAQLERMVTNVVGNALKFTPPGGTVTVRATSDGDYVDLSVADNGIGIPEAELPHVFDRFFRSSRSREQQAQGTGLGLAISKSIVDQHGGTIRAAATPGGGTTFVVVLPRLTAAESTAKEPA
ncbi:PAS domain S-box protein [Natronosporangium hydrolyticum]|uniref:histidine kinase n=1 Tax=Natronosporangium hydrolyticum TaxID=2811111 RepID=A0A895YKN2_9ACTN|nr:ATP-binding protein [Natronosporangium hydrolyticum]QSB16545.1 PAS domain S-box protein [Natronosporangium hydrolyticum]